jgi:hypothetical protein
MTGRTGEKCSVSGVYRCITHHSQDIPLSKGETFPPCKGDGRGHSTTWILVRKA